MKKLLLIFSLIAAAAASPARELSFDGETFLRQLTPRDSILIADQVEYGFVIRDFEPGTAVSLPDIASIMKDSLGVEIIRDWGLDSLRNGKSYDLSASLVFAAFDEGTYYLPPLAAQVISPKGVVDTLLFEAQVMEVKTMPVDTATFEIHDLKGQITYPVTFSELAPYIGGGLLLAALVALVVWLVVRSRRKKSEAVNMDPPYIVALRNLEKFRGEKFWAPEKQKLMYSGITDTLRTYIGRSFGVDAEGMTTGEIFSALKGCRDIPDDVYAEVKELFELSDFVKFAKALASDDDNARAIPTAVRFVTSTYQSRLEEQAGESAGGEEARVG